MQDQRLKVLQLIRNLDTGGAQEVVRTLAACLEAQGCDVVVGAFRDGPLRAEIERLGVPVVLLPDRQHSILALPGFLRDMLRIRRALLDVVREHEVDVVQTHLLRALDFLVLTLRVGQRAPLVFWTVHNHRFTLRADQLPRFRWLLGPKRFAYRTLYRLAAHWINGFIAVAGDVGSAVMTTIAPPPDKVVVICNGVDMERYQRPVDRAALRRQLGLAAEARVVCMVGHFKTQKGHRFLVEALGPLVARFPDLHLLLVGDGEQRAAVEAQVAQAGLGAHVHFLGNRSDVPALLAASDLFVLPSLWEGLPMALIEAMASGLPIVATTVSGTRQVMVSGETGLLVEPGDADALRDALAALLADPTSAQAMGAAAQRRVEETFSARQQAAQHLALYRRAWQEAGLETAGSS